jgi:hypothetical protein
MSRAAVAKYVTAPDAPRLMQQELGVNVLLTGSVGLAGERARISVHLVDAGTERAIWAEQYYQNIKDILQVQSEVASQIATALQAQLSDDERQRLTRPSTRNAAAYQLYLKATNIPDNAPRIEVLKQKWNWPTKRCNWTRDSPRHTR